MAATAGAAAAAAAAVNFVVPTPTGLQPTPGVLAVLSVLQLLLQTIGRLWRATVAFSVCFVWAVPGFKPGSGPV